MFFDPRTLILFGCNALLLYLTLLVNSSLAAHSLHLVLLGPMIVLPALYMHPRFGFACALLSGLWVDAALHAPFGLFTCAFLSIGTAISMARVRFRVEHNYHPVLLAHIANITYIALLTLTAGAERLATPAFWIQTGVTTVLSHLALLIIAPWFFNLERLLFSVFRTNTEPENFPIS